MEPIEVIRNSNKAFVRHKYLIWNGGTDTQTDTQTDRQTDSYIELRYAQLININRRIVYNVYLTKL